MKLSIKNTIYKAIVDKHWLDIDYLNSKKELTHFCCGIFDISFEKGLLYVDIFNPYKDDFNLLSNPKPIKICNIKRAEISEQTYYETPSSLIKKVTSDPNYIRFLEVDELDNNILKYLSDCYRQDNDPYIKESILIEDIYTRRIKYKKEYFLDEIQFKTIINKIFKTNIFKAEINYRYNELAINDLAVDLNGKLYVVAYYHLELDFKTKSLKIDDKAKINKSFLIEGKKINLSTYLDIDPADFCENYNDNKEEYKERIKENLKNGEIINTAPHVFLLRKESQKGVDECFESIHEMESDPRGSQLPHPLKAFFGNNKSKGSEKEFNIVVFDKNKINKDQMRVIYNAMSKHTTYVKGPPGTGKTETIFNVLLSAYCNNKTVLVCSNNNHPVDDIYKKMSKSLFFINSKGKKINIDFPIIRLGNMQEMQSAILKLKEFNAISNSLKNQKLNENLTEISKNKSLTNFKSLKSLLDKYEQMITDQENLKLLQKISKYYNIPLNLKTKYTSQMNELNQKIKSYPSFDDTEFSKYVTSASNDESFQNFLYYSSLIRLKKLQNQTYKELRSIIEIDDTQEAANQLSKYIKDDKNLNHFLNIFPVVLTTNLSAEKLGSPTPHFDLVIMDEAGQCNVASSLIPIIRGKDLVLVGDTNQLQPVTVLENNLNEKYKKSYNVSDDYDYIQNSILSTMLRKDANSTRILLGYHYRCGKKIAGFVNQRFYEQQLKVMNNHPGNLTYINVKNEPIPEIRNAYIKEAKEVANFIKTSGYEDVGIITPFRNQATLINFYLKKLGIDSCSAGTIHTLQGSEKSTIILSSALSLKTAKKTLQWVQNNAQLINVAVSRAKDNLIFVGDKEAIDTLSNGQNTDIKALSDYISSGGNMIVPKSENILQTDFSNNSKSEKLFFETITPYFARKKHKFIIERNVPVIKAIKNINPEDLKIIGKKEFDLIIKVSTGILRTIYNTLIVFEIDGGEHVGIKYKTKLDIQKAEICKKYGITLIRISNNEVRDYQLIINLFESTIIKSLGENYHQIDLFEDYN